MMWVGDKSGDGAEDGERLDFQVRGRGNDEIFVQRNVRVVFFVDVQVFYETFVQEIIEGDDPLFQELTCGVNIRKSVSKKALPTSICFAVTLGRSFSTMIIGLQIRPPSLAMYTFL